MKCQPVKPGHISHYDYMGEIKFQPGKVGQFSAWYLFRFVYIFLVFLCKHVLSYVFIQPGWSETIAWENYIPTKWDPDSTKRESRLAGMKLSTCHRRI